MKRATCRAAVGILVMAFLFAGCLPPPPRHAPARPGYGPYVPPGNRPGVRPRVGPGPYGGPPGLVLPGLGPPVLVEPAPLPPVVVTPVPPSTSVPETTSEPSPAVDTRSATSGSAEQAQDTQEEPETVEPAAEVAPVAPSGPVSSTRIINRKLGLIEQALQASELAKGASAKKTEKGVKYELAGGGIVEIARLPNDQSQVSVRGCGPEKTEKVFEQIVANLK